MNRITILFFVIFIFFHAQSNSLSIKNESGHHIKIGIRYRFNDGHSWGTEKDVLWLLPNQEKIIPLEDLSIILLSINVAFVQEVHADTTQNVAQTKVPTHPKIISEIVSFKIPNKKYEKLLRTSIFAPAIIISADMVQNKPVILMPKDVDELEEVIKKAIEAAQKAYREQLSKIKKEVRKAVPSLPSGEGEGAVIGIIGEYAIE